MKQIIDSDVAGIGRDPDLLERFYREHAGALRAFLARRVDRPDDVADLAADTFLAAIDHADRYRPAHGSPRAWLFGIARHKVADSQRGRARRLRAESRIVGHRLLDEDAISRIEDRLESEKLTRALYRALAVLPVRDRQLMELVAVDGMSVTEAAEQLGVKPGTARVRLHRSRARLRDHLGEPALLESMDVDGTVLIAQEATV